jgi:NADP-dependent 3-hydroxy acid dehydrogenase YdfG
MRGAVFHSPGDVRFETVDDPKIPWPTDAVIRTAVACARRPRPVRRYLPHLIDQVLTGRINPGKVFDPTLPLDQVAESKQAMAERRAIKALLTPCPPHSGRTPTARPRNAREGLTVTTFALVGAGPGLGLATARRFGTASHSVALISRNVEHLDALTADLSRDGVPARGFAADVLDPDSLTTALEAASETLGPIEILQYSPVPRADFMKPVLDTRASDLDAPLAFSVKGPVTCVDAVLPGMRALGRGTVLFVNGGSAVRPHPERAGTSIAFAAESAYARMLHDALAPENIHTAQLIIPGAIRPEAEHSSPDVLAERLYALHTERTGFRHYAEPLPE